jgi:hypothetical protein
LPDRVRGYDLAARQRLLLQFIPREREEPSPRECVAAECVAGFGGEVQSKTVLLNSQYWLGRAEEARLLADEMIYPDLRREMLKVAAGYRRLAERALERTARKDHTPSALAPK